jgi:hypothetical protein
MSEVGTLASITIMARVAEGRGADDMEVPCYDPMVVTIMDGARQAYREEGREDQFKPGSVHYVSAQQFAYLAAVTGMMLRTARPRTSTWELLRGVLFLAETET